MYNVGALGNVHIGDMVTYEKYSTIQGVIQSTYYDKCGQLAVVKWNHMQEPVAEYTTNLRHIVA